VIDYNGYILISEDNRNDTGRFFGEVEGAIMEMMVKEQVFDKITIYDYQGLCMNETRGNETNSDGSASGLISVSLVLLNCG
jgi:voltage-dependent calcium channel alpha-2/delta-3